MPRFPFKRSVAQDLRDLWAIDRIDRQSRNLGLSSLSPGDGSLDLIDGGSTVARYGDIPGGGFGIGVPDGSGGWRTVQQDAQARADAAQTAAAADATTKANAAQSAAVSSANGYTDTKTASLPGLSSEVASARGGFETLGARLSEHASRLGSLENYDTTISQYATSNIGRLWADLGALRDWVEQYKANLPTSPSAPSIRTEQAL